MNMRNLGWLGLLLLLPAGTASAVSKGELDVGAYFGGFRPSKFHELYDADNAQHYELTTGPAMGLRVGFQPNEIMGLEIEGELMPSQAQDVSSALLSAVRLQGVFWAPMADTGMSIVPCFMAGVGTLGVSSAETALGKDSDLAVHWGMGVEYGLTSKLELRADFRHTISAHWGFSTQPANHYGLVVGVAYRLRSDVEGKPDEAPDLDGDGIADDVDECRASPETLNGYDDDDGCPDRLAVVSVVVRDPDGVPVEGAKVIVDGQELGLTDAEGTAEIPDQMPETMVMVEIDASPRLLPSRPGRLTLEADHENLKEFKLFWAPSRLHVVAKTAEGVGVAAEIFFLGDSEIPAAKLPESGELTIDLPPGQWRLMIEYGSERLKRQTVEIEAGVTTELELEY